MSTQNPFGSAGDDTLVDETAIDRDHKDLFGLSKDMGELVFTREQLDAMDTQLLRRLAAQADTSEIHGKSLRLEYVEFFGCQRSLSEYEE